MRLFYTTDIHASPGHLNAMLETARSKGAQAVVVGGDLIPHHLPGTRSHGVVEAQAIYLETVLLPALDEFRRTRDIPVYLDLGNDDFTANQGILEKQDGQSLHLLHMRRLALTAEIDLIGYMNVPPTPFGRKDRERPDCPDQRYAPGNAISRRGWVSGSGSRKEIRLDLNSPKTIEADLSFLSSQVQRPFVFVSHAPPYSTPLDVIHEGLHVGSLAVRRFMEKWAADGRLLASLHGHIHESPRVSGQIGMRIGQSLCLNPGQGESDGEFRYLLLELSGAAVRLLEPMAWG